MVVPLGVKGGPGRRQLVGLPGGGSKQPRLHLPRCGQPALRPGVEKAAASHVFTTPVEEVLRQRIKGYCLSHPHLDYGAGLLLNAPTMP
jgi:hypothetical protein